MFRFQPLDGQCYTKFRNLLWPCLMEYFRIDFRTIPSSPKTLTSSHRSPMKYSHKLIQFFSLVSIRNLNNYSFDISTNNNSPLRSLMDRLGQSLIDQYQGQYLTKEKITEDHLFNSMFDLHR